MPQISKVRIVNFNYNDGNRLIADELYDFSSKEMDNALNILINLVNGGGKSVLVQLMLQPIVPKARVAGRRIESFFSKPSDHCFVLLEWLKDNSTEKLMTGIAMSAGEALSGEDDTTRGRSVKYYTFYSNYTSYNTQYDIVNLPLSKKENGKFIAAGYDTVRTLARKSYGVLNCYGSEYRPKWHKKLEEYGLNHDEWKMIEKLNSVEGGVSTFFGDIKSSDSLIDNLLIPTIEGKLNQVQIKEDNSLSTMLLSYAKQYVSKQAEIENKKIYESFEQRLTQLKPKAEKLFNTNDSLECCIGKLFGLQNALTLKLDECKAKQEKYSVDIENLENKINRIRHEQASAEFYSATEEYEEVNNQYTSAKEKEEQLKDKLKAENHSKAVLECADYYRKLLEVEGEINAIQAKITMQEKGADFADELASLKYSVFAQVCDLLEKRQPEADRLKNEKEDLIIEKQKSEKEYNVSKKENKKAEIEYYCAETTLNNAEKETEKELSQLGIEIPRQLDNTYDEVELQNIKTIKETEKNKLITEKTKADEEKSKIEEELSAIPQKSLDLCFKKREYENQKNSVEEKLLDYRAKEDKIKNICTEYNLDFSKRFTDYIFNFLESEQNKNSAKSAELIRKIAISDEEITAAKKGYLHVPSSVIDYLNSTGVRYSTCEKYLTEQVAEGKLTNEECLEILRNYPATAYGVLMEPEEKKRFFDYGREKWLPAMIPLFTYGQMAQILQNSRKFDGAIAFYSEEYFADKTVYLEQLQKAHENLLSYQKLLNKNDKKLKRYIDIAKDFDFSEDWESRQNEILCSLEESIKQCDEENSALNKLKASLTDTKEILTSQIKNLDEDIRKTQYVLDGLERVYKRIEDEIRLTQLLHRAKGNYDEAKQKLSQVKSRLESLNTDLDNVTTKLINIEKEINELSNVKNEIGECTKAELKDGHWRELLTRYQSLSNKLKQEVSVLKDKLSIYNSRKKDIEKELNKRKLDLNEYKDTIYSAEQLDNVEQSIGQLSTKLDELVIELNGYIEKRGATTQRLNTAKSSLIIFGEPLAKAEVGTDFKKRIDALRVEISEISVLRNKCAKKESSMNATLGRLKDRVSNLSCPPKVPAVELEDCEEEQFDKLFNEYKTVKTQCNSLNNEVRNALQEMNNEYAQTTCGVNKSVEGMLALLSNDKRGDIYYTLSEHIDVTIDNSQKMIAKITTDLQEFENTHNDLVRQCTLQGERIYEGLLQMAASSRVTVYEGKDKKQMIRFDIPPQVDPIVATASISDEIDKGTKELVEKLLDESFTEVNRRKAADKIIGSRNLLRKYIGKEAIRVDAYKIDQNPQNAGYRTWEQTQVNNSGAEKFVVYFAVILSLMNYTRGDFGDIRDKDLRSTLILDNPFGATSSKHILMPMFAIAKHFRVQMVCLSDITKFDVVNCFDIVIKAIVKKRPMSNHEILTHEGNESIEHGYYRSEQITLL